MTEKQWKCITTSNRLTVESKRRVTPNLKYNTKQFKKKIFKQ